MAEKSETLVTKEERINEAKELFGRGSRNFCMKQFAEAADDLSACCAIYSELHGPQAEECGLPYLLYAKSLIALGKDENNLIVPGDEEEEVDDDEEGGEGEEGEEGEEGGEGEEEEAEGAEKEQDEKGDKEEGDDAKMDTDEATKEDAPKEENKSAVVEKGNGEADKKEKEKTEKDKPEKEEPAEEPSSTKDAQDDPQPGPSTSNGTTTAQEETEDAAGNLQVAWEILELAVKIFQEQGETAYENLSECYSELAGISFENSHFQEAINDYTKAMEISKKTNKSDLRMLAEVHYKVGLCHLMVNDFDASVKSFHGAVTELDKVIEEEKAKEQTDETKETIEELEETKKEILEKVADVEEAKKTSIEEVKRELSKIIVSGGGESSNGVNNGAGPSSSSSSGANGASNGSATTAAAAAPAKPANDISHLIKRKKPDSVSTEVEGSPAKKTASETENAHNTSA